jgi:glutamate synthase (NADPH) large chain
LSSPWTVEEHDACALYGWIAKDARPAHGPVDEALAALQHMLHRAGSVDGEGDGCGLMLDIPRELWAEEVRAGGHAPDLALDPSFAVAHVL